ncbi:amidase [Acuticoccus sp. I52.16.1]|uniref:amidase n=1 Tax=Acuticoccus sp. I52.16.1 TaxID=2928472 RepID=UPI001FD468B9|nr:amidase [Acuticoccus sp. I52.16.1]UOM35189.1 amidase [Acuticoccus sp. I52.16.1]
MAIQRPDAGAVAEAGAELGLNLSPADAASFHGLMQGLFDAYEQVAAMAEPLPPVRYPRTPGRRPAPADNPYGAWATLSEIKGAKRGKLAGRTVAIKDNTAVAGVAMANGASVLAGYVPEIDATVVTRLLDAGATILGKAQCEYYCASGGSHTSWPHRVENPAVPGYNAGGSSSGSAALVAAGIVDMATGGDQGGSIRIPASFCGIVGMKPTHGLVPYTGIFQVEQTIDHTGPMTRTVADNALMLEVMAGPDGLDPRQKGAPAEPYTQALSRGVAGLTIGVVPEGFTRPGAEAAVNDAVHAAAERLGRAGARIVEMPIPMHAHGNAIWTPIFLEGATRLMMQDNAYGTNAKGVYLESQLDAHGRWRGRADELSETLKLGILMGHYMASRHNGRYYGKAQNLNRALTAAYDAALTRCDALLMPATAIAATPLPGPDATREQIVTSAFAMTANTAPFCATGHPSISVPVGPLADGRPVGAMLTGAHLSEMMLYRIAAALEAAYR